MAAASKSSAEEAALKDQDKVVVTLSVRGPCPIPKRRLVLTPDQPTVSIGRSSKVQTKGFIPAHDNAWFENPVMSRQHAELIAKFAEEPIGVYIGDVGSFHGTYHTANDGQSKEQRVTYKLPVKLTSGDILRFGMDIHRSDRSYPPSSVDFRIEEMTKKPDDTPHRAFTVPDYVDDEDENSEDEADLAITASRTKVNPANPEPKVDPCVPRPSAGFDVGSPAPAPSNGRAISTVPTRAICIPHGEIAMPSSETALPSSTTVMPSSATAMPSSTTSIPSLAMAMPSSATAHSDDEDMDEYPDFFSDDDLEREFSQYSNSESGDSFEAMEEMGELADAQESSQNRDTPPEIRHGYESGSLGEVFYDNDGLSDADLATNYEDSDGNLYSDIEDYDDHDDESDEDDEDDKQRLASIPFPVFCGGTAVHPHSSMSPDPLARTSSPKSCTSQNPSHARDPSPSDAALVKRRPLLDNAPNAERAQQLGEKSGKFEFFAAREQNRATVSQAYSTVSNSAIEETLLPISQQAVSSDPMASVISDALRSDSPSLSCVPETTPIAKDTVESVSQGSIETPEAPEASSIKLSDMDTNQYSAWTTSGDQFINNPPTDEPPLLHIIQCERGGLDMTSAYKFHQSKLATAAEAVSKTRRVPIQDLLAQEPKECSIASQPTHNQLTTLGDSPTSRAFTPNKRSYEEAFDQAMDDTTSNHADRIITRPPPCIGEENNRDQIAQEKKVDIAAAQNTISAQDVIGTAEQGQLAHETPVVPVRPEGARPVKRMRLATAVQVVACVALGGAATFSYLVNTAPVF